jgi:hypothetical protein
MTVIPGIQRFGDVNTGKRLGGTAMTFLSIRLTFDGGSSCGSCRSPRLSEC